MVHISDVLSEIQSFLQLINEFDGLLHVKLLVHLFSYDCHLKLSYQQDFLCVFSICILTKIFNYKFPETWWYKHHLPNFTNIIFNSHYRLYLMFLDIRTVVLSFPFCILSPALVWILLTAVGLLCSICDCLFFRSRDKPLYSSLQ